MCLYCGVVAWRVPKYLNRVYKAGFAVSYETAVVPLFDSLDRLEKMLTGKESLVGGILTEADIRLWVTIIRFDPVYVGHFKCNLRTIRSGYMHSNTSHVLHDFPLLLVNSTSHCSQNLDIGNRSNGHDPTGIDGEVRPVVMRFDVLEIGRILEGGVVPIQFLHPRMDSGVPAADGTEVAFEVTDIDGVKPDDGDPKPDVGFGQDTSNEIVFSGQHLLKPIKRIEKWHDGFLVCLLRRCKSRLVHPIVDSIIYPFIDGIDFSLVRLRIDIQSSLVFWDDVIESRVEDANDVGTLIVHDRVVLLVP